LTQSKLPKGITLTPSGKFRANVMVNGVRHTATLATRTEAEAFKNRAKQGELTTGTGHKYSPWTALQAWNHYVDQRCASSHSKRTTPQQFSAYGKLILDAFGCDTLLDDITPALQAALFDHMTLVKGLSASYVNHVGTCVYQMQLMAYERNHKRNAPVRMQRARPTEGRRRILSEGEEDRALEWLSQNAENEFKDLFAFWLDTGSRKSEALTLAWTSVDFDAGSITFEGRFTKNGRTRRVPMSQRVRQMLERRRDQRRNGPTVFAPISDSRLYGLWDAMRHALGLADEPDFVIHMLRHTCCTRLLRIGVPSVTVQQMMGHASLSTTESYSHFDVSQNDEVVAALDAINQRHNARAAHIN
jgi:integrase